MSCRTSVEKLTEMPAELMHTGRGSRYLYGGACQTVCPPNTIAAGTGRYGRECVTPLPGQTCVPRAQGCQSCTSDRTACVQCRDSRYLHQGSCVESCPEGTIENGLGQFNRLCRPPGATCIPRRDNCHFCDSELRFCTKCRNQHFLHLGACVETCPSNTRARGTGFYNRECV